MPIRLMAGGKTCIPLATSLLVLFLLTVDLKNNNNQAVEKINRSI